MAISKMCRQRKMDTINISVSNRIFQIYLRFTRKNVRNFCVPNLYDLLLSPSWVIFSSSLHFLRINFDFSFASRFDRELLTFDQWKKRLQVTTINMFANCVEKWIKKTKIGPCVRIHFFFFSIYVPFWCWIIIDFARTIVTIIIFVFTVQ